MKAIISDDLKRKLNELIVIITISTIFVLIQVASFPLMQAQIDTLKDVINIYPPELVKLMNLNLDTVTKFDQFISMKHFSSTWIIFLLLIVFPAATSLNKEKSNRTMELLMTQPISRVKLATAKYISGLLRVFIFVIPSIILTIPLVLVWQIESTPIHYVYYTIMALCFSSVVYSATFFLGSIFSGSSKSYLISISAILGFYTITAISSMVKDLENLKYFSAFYYFDSNIAFIDGRIEFVGSTVFIIFSIIFALAGIYIFNKKDVL